MKAQRNENIKYNVLYCVKIKYDYLYEKIDAIKTVKMDNKTRENYC